MVGRDPDRAVRVLYVGEEGDRAVAALEGSDGRFSVAVADGVASGIDRATDERFDCVVSRETLPDGTGVDLLRRVARDRPGVATVLVTADEECEGDTRDPATSGLPARVEAAVEVRAEQEGILDRMTDAFFALDAEWRFTYLNERGRQVVCDAAGVEATVDELLGENLWDLVPEAVGTAFDEEYRRAMETGESVAFEERYAPLGTWFEVRAYPSPTGLSVYFRDVTERKEREREREERERVLTRVHRTIADKDTSLDAKVEQLLAIGREVLGTEYGALSRVEDDDYVFEVVDDPTGETGAGTVVPLEATNCERTVVTEETLVLSDVGTEAPDLTERAGYTEWGIECYVGTPVVVEGEVYGTFCFYDRTPRAEPFDDWEVTIVELMGNWISYEKER
ncbi:MAG: GAF domain-containing protein, partial [Haloferacaceae archaeon]